MFGGPIRIATRGSDLALWQANWVADRLRSTTDAKVELVVVASQGDREREMPLHQVEGVGFFTKEIEFALLDGRADVAVHSHKDLPTEETPGLTVAAVPERAAPNDWLLIRSGHADAQAPCWPIRRGARVGTCSLRRSAQLQHRRCDLGIADLRGNVPRRVQQLREGAFDAIVLAQAGLDRMGLELSGLVVVDLLPSGFLPAAGQGALAIQCRADDEPTKWLLSRLDHAPTARCVRAERGLSAKFEGGCSLALGCLASPNGEGLELRAAWPGAAGDFRHCRVVAADPESAARRAFEELTAP